MSTAGTQQSRDALLLIINGIVNSLAYQANDAAAHRRDARYSYNQIVTIGLETNDGHFKRTCSAWAVDMSYNGMGFITDIELLVGKNMFVKLIIIDGQEEVFPIRIVHCRKLFGAVCRIGTIFLLD